MNELSLNEIDQVSGGDSWAGTPEGRAPGEGLQSRGPLILGSGIVALVLAVVLH